MSPRLRRGDVVAFLGPSLPGPEALALGPLTLHPPARAGDVHGLLAARPLAIALIDGLFDAAPSVWHHELLAAQAAGVQVFGGGSMGALRAAELAAYGVVGVGRIFAGYRDGVLAGDDEVALLHGPGAQGWRPLTVPLVDARRALEEARAAGLITAREAGRLLRAAAAIFYQERSWGRLIEAARLPAATAAALRRFLPRAPSQKREDAASTLRAALDYARARRAGAPPPPPPQRPPPPTQARRLALDATRARIGEGEVAGREVLAALTARPDAGRLAADGLGRLLLAAQARAFGLYVDEAEVADAGRRWLAGLGVPASRRDLFLAACALDDGEVRRLAEGLALEARLRAEAARAIPDGPGWLEGLALGARLSGAWAAEAARLASPSRGRTQAGQSTHLTPAGRPKRIRPRPAPGAKPEVRPWPKRRGTRGRSGWR
jgi:hypothetical protein